MGFKGKALFNLLKLSHGEDPTVEVKPWQIASYRSIETKHLFDRLKALGICLDEPSFSAYADSIDTPEELIDFLYLEEEHSEDYEEAYLIVFELWRRLLSKKQSLSLFGDELDHLIFLYDRGELLDEEQLQRVLSELEDILDQSVDAGASPEETLEMVSQYLAHDLEAFLYDYIIDQMDEGNDLYASELIDGFFDYVSGKRWFEFLKARLFAVSNSEESELLLLGLLEQEEEEPDLELIFEIARYVVIRGDTDLFIKAGELILSEISKEEDFRTFLDLLAEFHRCLDKEQTEKAVIDLIKKRSDLSGDTLISKQDKQMALQYLKDTDL